MCATRLWGRGRRLDGTADPAWEARVAELWKAIGTHENNWLGRRGGEQRAHVLRVTRADIFVARHVGLRDYDGWRTRRCSMRE